jgi:general secretion pathway protein D
MKRLIAIVFCVFLYAPFITGCAGSAPLVKENHGIAAGGAPVAQAAAVPIAPDAVAPEKGADAARVAPLAAKVVEAEAPVAKKAPEKKAFVDKDGKFEISATPFGYVKREKKPTDKDAGAIVSRQQETVALPAPTAVKAGEPVPAAAPAVTAAAAPVPGPTAPPPAKGGLAGPPPAPHEKPERSAPVSFDFDDADLYAVIRVMADYLKINYIIDPSVSGKVTIHTAGVLKGSDVFPVFYQTLEVNGLTAVKEGEVYRILRIKDASRMPVSSRLTREVKDIAPEERIILQIIPLKFISAQEAAKVITPFVSADGTIISEGGSNTLLVVDKGINILKILKLTEVLDVSMFEKITYRFYNFKNASAEDASKTLGEIVSLSSGGSKGDVKFIPIKWLNALLVVSSSPDVFAQIEGLISQLDTPSEGAQPQIHVYSVKNGMAADLGDVLNAIFGKGGEVKKSTAKDSVPTNPFAKGFAEKKTSASTSRAGAATIATSSGSSAATPTPTTTPTPTAGARSVTTEKGASVALRGDIKITVDSIRNALIIEATAGDYMIVEKILDRLDILPRQVLIEVMIAEISLGQGTDLGIEWTFKKDNWTDTGSLAAAVGKSGLSYAVGLSQKWQAVLHALANESKLNILSSPSVLASDNKQARIDVTTEVPIPSTSFTVVTNGVPVLETKIEYRNTGIILDVTPHINEFGLVTMDISQEVSSVGELLKVAGQDYYSFNNRKILTSLTVKHNQSIVIGGLIAKQNNDASSGVPWLVKVPFLRWLFGTEKTSESKSELIVMITPHVINSLDDVDNVREEFTKKMKNALKKFE